MDDGAFCRVKFFLGHNILEYKSPDDAMNIDTFYKVLSYGRILFVK